jgi:single-stranded-DNA-specific exonuclease
VEVVEELERAGPFGAGNPEPIFVFPAHRIVDAAEVGNGHLRIRAKAGDGAFLNGIAFRQAHEPLGQALMAAKGEPMHLAGSLAIDRWGGGERVQLRLLDAAKPVKRL